ncbi:MAG TPA: hypothetical protein DHV28_00675 [Ignavibacteriales bacterium]|nr:hypothetical protein [Ignavibacteriales bacterium]
MIEQNKNIAVLQNEITSLEKLSAQNYLYSSAKKFKALQIILSVVVIVIISFLKIIFEKKNSEVLLGMNWNMVSPYFSLLSVLVTIVNVYILKSIISQKIKLASLIQYDFDTYVMNINKNIIYQENCPPYEDIWKYSLKNKKKGYPPDFFKDWYSPYVDSLDKSVSNFICLKTNLVWDMNLRTIYRNSILILLILLSVLLLIPSFILGVTIKSFTLEVLIPLMPLFTFSISEIMDNNKTILNKKRIKTIIDLTWDRILSKTIFIDELSKLSKECLEYLIILRRENPIIFDWFFNLTKKSSNDEMNYSADRLIKEYKNRS